MIDQQVYFRKNFRSHMGYSATTRTGSLGSVVVPIATYARPNPLAQISANKIQLLESGKFLLSIDMNAAIAGGGNTNPGSTTRFELVKNSTVLAFYQVTHNFGASNTTSSHGGWTGFSNYWNDSANHATNPANATVAGSSTSFDCKLFYEEELQLLSSDLIFLNMSLATNAGGTMTATLREINVNLSKLT